MGGGLGCDTTCIDYWFCIIAAILLRCCALSLGFAKSRCGEAGLKDLALVNAASSPLPAHLRGV